MRLRVARWPEPLKRRRFRWNCNGETGSADRYATLSFCMIAVLAVCGGIVSINGESFRLKDKRKAGVLAAPGKIARH